jgi:THO complex subunit 2
MAPSKRKRSDRTSIDSGDQGRPSPHRPADSPLAQHGRDARDGGGRRSSRGGQGGQGGGQGTQGGGRRGRGGSNPHTLNISGRATPTAGPMSPPAVRPSSAIQPPTPTVEVQLPSPSPRQEPEPYAYVYLTDDRIATWTASGRKEVIAMGTDARTHEDEMELSAILQEFIRATIDIRIDATDAGNCVQQIIGPDTAPSEDSTPHTDPQTLFIDTLSMMIDAEPGANPAPKELQTFPQALRPFVIATGVSPITLRQKLDASLAQNLGLTRDTFIRVGIRQATHLLYRQANYNLLREETEGYSKLVTELFTTSGSEAPSIEVIQETFEKLKGLIGTFDLDVGRVLDITLDVFAAVLIKQFRFFIRLLRASSWWPRSGETDKDALTRCDGLPKWALPTSSRWASNEEDEAASKEQRSLRDAAFWTRAREVGLDAFFELGGREPVDAETKQRLSGEQGNGDAELGADRQWIEATGTFPPSGNRTAAQLLGFKLRFYSSEARDKEDILPANLIYLTALLIKVGFISLRDLYPHLWPLDEAMEGVRELRRKELEEKERASRSGGASNALMMAGALVDDTIPNGRSRETAPVRTELASKGPTDAEDEDKLDEPTDQKVQLLTCLLTIGAIPEALFILGRFPWLPEAYPELLDLIHRILNHSIKDVYDLTRQAPPVPPSETKHVAQTDQMGVPKGEVRTSRLQPRKQLRWPFPDKHDTNESSSYRFYWDEWADNIPICQSVDDVFTLCSTFLNFSGVSIGKDTSLLTKLVRIGVTSLTDDPSEQNLDRWHGLLKRLLVPALSHTKANTSVVNEIYIMLRFYPVSVRYNIYAEWFEGQISRLPAMRIAFTRTRYETLAVMKRISKENLTEMARGLAKTAYASPGIVFSVALSQIEVYTNLTDGVVECAKYFSDLGYDVLVWSLLTSLGGKDRDRNNAEYVLLPSRWLIALSRFAGKVFQRYPNMNLSPIVQYVNDQLYRGNSTDLVILKELIRQMAGIVPDTDFTDEQLAGVTGGQVLRKQTLIGLQDTRYKPANMITAQNLMKALTETKIGGQFLISIAQHRQSVVYSVAEDIAHIKLLSTLVDDSQMILFQYLDLLRSNLSVEEFDSHVPDIPQLLTDFGLDPALAFLIGRASLSSRIASLGTASNGNKSSSPSPPKVTDSEGDIPMDREVIIEGERVGESATSPPISSSSNPIDELFEPIISTIQNLLPEESWTAISPEFYVTFWTATNRDIAAPVNSYKDEIARLSNEELRIAKDRTDMTRDGMKAKDRAKIDLKEIKDALMAEWAQEISLNRHKKQQILRKKALWFEHSVNQDTVSDAILEKCIFPRLLLSPTDAEFCFRMIRFLHDSGTPTFRTLSLYGRIFRANRLRSMMFACTVREADNLGRFLRLVLTDLSKWWKKREDFEKEAWGKNQELPGFAKAVDESGKPKGLLVHEANGQAGPDGKPLLDFKSILFIWHKALNTALRDCLDGNEWMHIRNAMTIIKSVAEVFPAVDFMGNQFIRQLETVAKREKNVREDLALTGNAVLVLLKQKSTNWMSVQAFGSTVVSRLSHIRLHLLIHISRLSL